MKKSSNSKNAVKSVASATLKGLTAIQHTLETTTFKVISLSVQAALIYVLAHELMEWRHERELFELHATVLFTVTIWLIALSMFRDIVISKSWWIIGIRIITFVLFYCMSATPFAQYFVLGYFAWQLIETTFSAYSLFEEFSHSSKNK